MTNSVAFPRSIILQTLVISSALLVLLAKTGAEDTLRQAVCPSFSCGHLQDIKHPFRLRGDPPGCGVQEYELVCRDSQAIIHIDKGRYFVTNISYNDSVFWVVDASLDNSSCPIPERNQHPYIYGLQSGNMTLLDLEESTWAAFVSCSRMIKDNAIYRPVACRSTNTYFVYVLTSMLSYSVRNVQPSCGYLAMTPLGSWRTRPNGYGNYDYEDVVKFMRTGFAVRFPLYLAPWKYSRIINRCLNSSLSKFHEKMSSSNILNQTLAIVGIDMHFLRCVNYYSYQTKLFWAAVVMVSACLQYYPGCCLHHCPY